MRDRKATREAIEAVAAWQDRAFVIERHLKVSDEALRAAQFEARALRDTLDELIAAMRS